MRCAYNEMPKVKMKKQKGFTILESLLAIVVISVVLVAVGYILLQAMRSYTLVIDRREALQEARLAVNMMTNEIQTIANPTTDISSISTTSMTFTKAGGGGVVYSISGGELFRGSNILATNVSSQSRFDYYTAGGALTSNPSQVYRVHIALEVDTGDTASGKVMLNNNIYLRNRYYSGFTQL